ncbi:MAG: sterol desaturase family protein [Polyangiaceae bacterium]|nr:sterol desaturase family protein [Polyangiaceae bacterium]
MRRLTVTDLVGAPLAIAWGAVASVLEARRPLRPRVVERRDRYPINASFALGAALAIRLVLAPAMVATACAAERRGFGVLRWTRLRGPAGLLVGFLVLDYAMYWLHRADHHWPLLWRFHRAHHADIDVDATTAVRFHPGEVLLTIPGRCLQVALAGVGPRLALAYEVALLLAALFHHSNIDLGDGVDTRLSKIVTTPRTHGIHHSIEPAELDSNFGLVFSLWDRLHGTVRANTHAEAVVVGLADLPPRNVLSAVRSWLLPFSA